MSRRRLALLLVLLPLLWAEAKPRPTPAPDPAKQDGFKAFHYVRVRNIFDPGRRKDPAEPGSEDSAASARASAADSSRGAPFFALVGVMTRPEKQVGFFTGSSGDYQKVLGAGQAIAGYQLKSVTMAGVEMERDGKAFVLPVGRQVRLDGAGAGSIQAYTAPSEAAAPLSSPSASVEPSSSTGSPPAPSSGSSPSDVLKRMMERRQQELSK